MIPNIKQNMPLHELCQGFNSLTKITKTAKVRKHTKKASTRQRVPTRTANFTKITRIAINSKIRRDLRGTQRELRKLQKIAEARRMPWEMSETPDENKEFYENYENY